MSIPPLTSQIKETLLSDFNERKIVKTISLKKVSAVAVASLGFGLLSVVPAKAAAQIDLVSSAVATAPTVATTTATPSAVGQLITADIRVALGIQSDAAGTVIGSTYVLTNPNGTVVTTSATFTSEAAAVANITATNTGAVYAFAVGNAATTTARKVGTMTFTPTMAGVYTLTYTTVNTTLGTGITNTVVNAGAAASFFVSGSGAVVASGGVGSTSGVTAVTGGQAQIRFATAAHGNSATYNLISSGVGQIQAMANGGATNATSFLGIAASADYSQGARVVTPASTDTVAVIATVASNVAGTQTLTWTAIDATTGAPTVVATQVITWGAAPAPLAQWSTSFIQAGTAAAGAADVDVVVPRTLGTQAANITVTLNSASATGIANQGLAATIVGPGNLGITNTVGTRTTAASGKSVSIAATVGNLNTWNISVWPDGTAGKSTITITSGTTTIATETVLFYGPVTKLTATQNMKVAVASAAGGDLGYQGSANSTTNLPAVIVVATDALGNNVPGLTTIEGRSSDTTVLVHGTVTEDASGTLALNSGGVYNAKVTSAVNGVSGAKASYSFRIIDPAGNGTTYLTSNAVEFTLGKAVVNSAAWSFDKTTYAPGEAMTLTLTAKDDAGNAVSDGAYTNLFSASPVLSKTLVVAPDASPVIIGGIKAYKTFAPAVGGPLSISSTFGTQANTKAATQGTTITAATSVTDGNAAIATSIASLNAKIVALNALIAKIMKRLNIR